MAHDHPKKVSSSSKKESNTNKCLSTRMSETISLSQPDKCAIIITRLFRFNARIIAESGNGNDCRIREFDAQQKDYAVQQFCKTVKKNASNILNVCFSKEGEEMTQRIRAVFYNSPPSQRHSDITEIRREYEQKVTAPITEHLDKFSFHQKTNEMNMQILKLVRFDLIGSVSYLHCLCYSLSLVKLPYLNRNARKAGLFAEFVL